MIPATYGYYRVSKSDRDDRNLDTHDSAAAKFYRRIMMVNGSCQGVRRPSRGRRYAETTSIRHVAG